MGKILAAVFGALLLLVSQSGVQAQGLKDPRDAAKIFVEATAAGDADAIAALYAPKAILLIPNAPIISGRDAIRNVFVNNFAQGPNTIEFGNMNLDRAGTRAVVLWNWRSRVSPAGKEPVQILGRSLVYFIKGDDGWLISADMFQLGQ